MQCSDIRELLSAYIDEVLDDREKAAVENHLRICSDCSKELADLQETVSLLRSLGEVSPPEDFRQCLRERLQREAMSEGRREEMRQSLFRNILKGAWKQLAAAAVIICLGLGAGVYALQSDTGNADKIALDEKQEAKRYVDSSVKGEETHPDGEDSLPEAGIMLQRKKEIRASGGETSPEEESNAANESPDGLKSAELSEPRATEINPIPPEERTSIGRTEPDSRELAEKEAEPSDLTQNNSQAGQEPVSVLQDDAMENAPAAGTMVGEKESNARFLTKWILPLALLILIPSLAWYFLKKTSENKT